jgi:hypothetical protein
MPHHILHDAFTADLAIILILTIVLFFLSRSYLEEEESFFSQHGASKKKWMIRIWISLALGLCFGFQVGYLIVWSMLIYQVNDQMGFDYATPDEKEGEYFVISKVVHGKAMDKGSLQEDDRICFDDVDSLFQLLVFNQGREVEIPVKRGDIKLSIFVQVPYLKLSVNPEVIL